MFLIYTDLILVNNDEVLFEKKNKKTFESILFQHKEKFIKKILCNLVTFLHYAKFEIGTKCENLWFIQDAEYKMCIKKW